MGKLWLVIFVAGKVGGFAGPLPYDAAECERRADQIRVLNKRLINTKTAANGERLADNDKRLLLAQQMRFECIRQAATPVIEVGGGR